MISELELRKALELREKELEEVLEKCKHLRLECCEMRKAWGEAKLRDQGILAGTPVRFQSFRKQNSGVFQGINIVDTAGEGLVNKIEIRCVLKSGRESTLLLPWGYLDSLKAASPTGGQL